jgi:hypothetical protein
MLAFVVGIKLPLRGNLKAVFEKSVPKYRGVPGPGGNAIFTQ